MTAFKVTKFDLRVNPHKDYYETPQEYIGDKRVIGIADIPTLTANDYLAELEVHWVNPTTNMYQYIWVVGSTVQEVMDHFKNNHAEYYNQVPSFDISAFEAITRECQASSTLSYLHWLNTPGFDKLLEDPIDDDSFDESDYVGDYPTTADFIAAVKKKRILTEIRCYPNNPNGFWNYYSFDFESLLKYVVEE